MSTQPFFSVIIPTFNRGSFLKKAIASVLRQTCGDLELIIVDDGSTDSTRETVCSYKNEKIKYIYQENRGVASARNKGINISKGKFIAFLDSDDWWLSEKLERVFEYIDKYPQIHIFHTEEVWYRGGKLLPQKKKHKKPTGRVYKNALPLCCISISTAAIKRDVFDAVGLFDESFEACEDYDFWLRATSEFKVKLIPEYLTEKDGGRPDQLSSSVWGLDRFRIKALRKMLLSGLLDKAERDATLRELRKKCGIFAAGAEKKGKIKEAASYRNMPLEFMESRGRPGGHLR